VKRRDLLKLLGIAAAIAPFGQSKADWLDAPALDQETFSLDLIDRTKMVVATGRGNKRVLLTSIPLHSAIRSLTLTSFDGLSHLQLLRVPHVVLENAVSNGKSQLDFLPNEEIIVRDHPLTIAVTQQLPSDWAVAIVYEHMTG
jgi:hypothetical protein